MACVPLVGSIAVQGICYHMQSRVTVAANNIYNGNNLILYSTKFWWGKTSVNRSLISFGEENVGEFTIATLVNLKFGWVKYGEWHSFCQVHQSFPPPKFY